MSINLDDLRQLMIDVDLAQIDLRNKTRVLEQALEALTRTKQPERIETPPAIVDHNRDRC